MNLQMSRVEFSGDDRMTTVASPFPVSLETAVLIKAIYGLVVSGPSSPTVPWPAASLSAE